MRSRPPRDPFDTPSRTVVAEPVRLADPPADRPAVRAPVATERPTAADDPPSKRA